jgi:Ran GTPase-activating protein (RanGAP) involved in mRNA processing and transport
MKLFLCLFLLQACSSPEQSPKSLEDIFSSFRVETGNGSLSIPQEGLSDKQLIAILEDPRTPALWSIELSGNAIGKEGIEALLNSEKTREIRWLNLSSNHIDDAAIEILAASSRLSTIEQLLLASNEISEAGAKTLAESQHLSKLRVLSLGDQPIGDIGAKALAELSGLESLSLESAEITGPGASALIQKSDATSLFLQKNRLNEGLLQITAFSPGIENLDLRSCTLESAQILALGKAELGERLKLLRLDENPFGDAGIKALGKANWIADLKKLTVNGSGASVEARKGLREFWGKRGGMTIELR